MPGAGRGQDRKASFEDAIVSKLGEVIDALRKADFEAGEANCDFHETFRRDNDTHMTDLLASGFAHDLNNRLQSMASALSLMRLRVAVGRTSDLGSLIEIAERSLVGAGELAHRLMTVGRKTSHQSDNLVRLKDTILSMHDLLRCVAGEGIELRLALSDPEIWIRCDSHLLECAIINLVINSRDAMPKGGIITIETRKACSPKGDDGQDYVSVSVTDSGCGIAPDVLEKVFEPFFTTKPQGVGTGLGLTMMRHFVDQARGYIEVHSTPRQGTCIELYLPVAAES